MFADRH